MNRVRSCGVPLLLILLPSFAMAQAPTSNDAWPTHAGNTRRNAFTPFALPVAKLKPVWDWQATLPPQPAWFGPAKWDAYAGIRGLHSMRNYDPVFHTIAANGRIWFGSSSDDTLRCLDAASGKLRWQFTTEGPIRVAPHLDKGRLYFGSDDGFAYCVDANTGGLIWKHSVRSDALRILNNQRLISPNPVRTGVTVLDGVAYYAASLTPWNKSYLAAVDAATGKETKPDHFVHEFDNATFEGPLVVSPERIIAPQGRVAPLLFDRKTGKRQGALKGGGGSFVVLTPDDQVVHGPGNKTGWLTASKAGSREVIATFKQGNALVIAGSRSCILNDDSIVVSDWIKRKAIWQADCGAAYSMLVADSSLFVGVDDGVLIYDLNSGKQLQRLECRGRAYGLSASEGRLIVSTDEGRIVCFADSPLTIATRPTTEASPSTSGNAKTRPVTPILDKDLIGRWVFQAPYADRKRVVNLVDQKTASITPPADLATIDGYGAAELGGQARITLAQDHRKANLPTKELTAQAWVRLDKAQTWGAFLGALQDNGSYERGWLLGFRGQRFCFAVAGEAKSPQLTYLTEPQDHELGVWRHIAGVYDGKTMKLFVDGRLAAQSDAQHGPIQYPPTTTFELGGYHDDNEHYPTSGAVHEVRLFRRALSDDEIRRAANEKTIRQDAEQRVALGPYARFNSPTEATVYWRTQDPCPTVIVVEGSRRELSNSPTRNHQASIAGLRKQRVTHFQIEFQRDGETLSTRKYECDNFFNFTAVRSATGRRGALPRVPNGPGIGLLQEPSDALVLAALSRLDLTWIVVVSTAERRKKLVDDIHRSGNYGRMTVIHVPEGSPLPMTSAFADAIVSETSDSQDEWQRVLRPQGVLVRVDERMRPRGTWVRPSIPGSGDWTHIYGSPNNSAFAGESLSGVRRTDQLRVQWIGRPGARYQPDRNGRKPSPLASSGRLYLQGLERLIGLNSYNGTILWSLEVPHLGRFNMPRDCSNWCADNEHLFVAVDQQLWKINGATGVLEQTWAASRGLPDPRPGRQYDWGYVARSGEAIIGTAVTQDTAFREFWGGKNQGWYDAKSGAATEKVCSNAIFALDLQGQRKWTRECLAVHSTITISGDRLVFTESRNPALSKQDKRRAGLALNEQLFLVCLDVHSGDVMWERPVKDIDTEVVIFAAADDAHLSIVASAKNRYDIRTYELSSGAELWKKKTAWPSDNHGGHMSRPALVQNSLYVRPYAFDLNSGKTLSVRMPMGGCGTYAATKDMLVFRSKNVTIWDREKGDVTAWTRLRPDCWLSTIPADGLLLSPEGGGGCSCGSWMETSIGFIPKALLPNP